LQKSGVIRYTRGHIVVFDRQNLETAVRAARLPYVR
jgi:hypothetical protein